jgi:hypothetical protein
MQSIRTRLSFKPASAQHPKIVESKLKLSCNFSRKYQGDHLAQLLKIPFFSYYFLSHPLPLIFLHPWQPPPTALFSPDLQTSLRICSFLLSIFTFLIKDVFKHLFILVFFF